MTPATPATPAATLALDFDAPGPADAADTGDLDARFRQYHRDNPQVYREFKRAATRLLEAGVSHYGAGAIFEYLRFETAIRGDDGFKLNNNFRSRYSRLLAEEDARFAEFFEFRSLRS